MRVKLVSLVMVLTLACQKNGWISTRGDQWLFFWKRKGDVVYFEELLMEWKVKHKKLQEQFREFEEDYRNRIHSNLSDEEKVKRNFMVVDGKSFCDSMVKARTRKFRSEIESELVEFLKIQRVKQLELSFIQGEVPELPDSNILFQQHTRRTYPS